MTGIWKSIDFLPNWNYQDGIEITVYARERFSILVTGDTALLIEGVFEIVDIENDIFEIQITGTAQDNQYLNIRGRMYSEIENPNVVLTIPEYGERHFELEKR